MAERQIIELGEGNEIRPDRRRQPLRLVVVLALVSSVIIFGWHLYLTRKARRAAEQSGAKVAERRGEMSVSLNPITNVVEMNLSLPPSESDPLAERDLYLQLATGMPLGELNTKARESFDLYAMLIPYRLRISLNKEPHAEMLARIRAREEEKRAADEQRKRSYVKQGLTLENVEVSPGERFGRLETGVFGTIVNRGEKTLRKITVRIYFLDAEGHRIGETEYSPVLATKLAIGDNTPLRPGYRRDFGYAVQDHAPSGWANSVEAEIVDIAFLEEE